MSMRPDWDTVWMSVAHRIGQRSRCDGRQIGAIVVTPTNRPVSMGYNGPPAGLDLAAGTTCQTWCPRMREGLQTRSYENCVTVHAEVNALMFADRRDYEGGTLYVTSAICWDCGKVVANSGVARVVCRVNSTRDAHRDFTRTFEFMRSCGLVIDDWRMT